MMRMLGLALLGLFLWMSSSSVVLAQFSDPTARLGEPRISLFVCKVDKGQCTYRFHVIQNGTNTRYDIPPTDCNSAQSNGYTFTRALDNKSYHAQSPCSDMSIDTLSEYNLYRYETCMPFVGPICRNSKTTTTTTT
ncbi:hypothetical protein BCR42DRAFT_428543 [Absidia repens]|uniref:Secreted protein n=1 Tax=Absidia repens TaxID=90262 RepID=A0A1X2HYE2_9FUNG|nr:hypothetical protein BCR42DRAFT_428543 [Absidia repens]